MPRPDPGTEVVHADQVDRGLVRHAELVQRVTAEVRHQHGAVGRPDGLVCVRPLLPVLDGTLDVGQHAGDDRGVRHDDAVPQPVRLGGAGSDGAAVEHRGRVRLRCREPIAVTVPET